MFKIAVTKFAENMKQLRSFIALIDAFLATHVKGIKDSKRQRLTPFLLAAITIHPEHFIDVPISLDTLIEEYGGSISVSDIRETEQGTQSVTVTVPAGEGEHVLRALEEVMSAIHSQQILYEGSLMTLTSSVERFISQLIQLYYQKFPNALGGREKSFSLDDLKGFNSISEAQQFLIDSKVEDLMRKSFSDWIKFMKEILGLSMGYLKDNEPLLLEMFQRRHLLVHNGGIINSTYLSKVDSGLTKGLKIGERLEVNTDYLTERINLSELNCLLIGLEAWKKQEASNKDRGEVVLQLIEQHIVAERWSTAEGLSCFLMGDKKMAGREQVRAKLSYWYSIKNQGRWSEIKDEMATADFSAMDKELQLAYRAILDNNNSAFKFLNNSILGENTPPAFIEFNPMINSIREDLRCTTIEEKHHNKGDALKSKASKKSRIRKKSRTKKVPS